MVVKCVECGGKVSSEASACPHCGAPVRISLRGSARRRSEEEDSESEEDSSFSPPGEKFDFIGGLVGVVKGFFFLLAILVLLSAILFFSIRYDIGGLRTGLRKIADSDSGTGSYVDQSNSRVMFKYYLGKILDSLEGGMRKSAAPAPETPREIPSAGAESGVPPSAAASPSAPAPAKEPAVFDRVERKPAELPPPPPEE